MVALLIWAKVTKGLPAVYTALLKLKHKRKKRTGFMAGSWYHRVLFLNDGSTFDLFLHRVHTGRGIPAARAVIGF